MAKKENKVLDVVLLVGFVAFFAYVVTVEKSERTCYKGGKWVPCQ